MVKRLAQACGVVLITAGINLTPSQLYAAEPSAAEARAQLEATEAAMAEIAAWLEQANGQQSREEKRLQQATAKLEASSARLAGQRQAERELTQEISTLNVQQATQRAALSAQEAQLAELLRALHKQGDVSALRALLSGEAPSSSQRQLVLLKHLSAAQRQTLARYENQLASLAATAQELNTRQAQLSKAREALQREQQTLAQDRLNREQALSALAKSIGDQRSELEQLEIDKAGVQQLIDRLNAVLQQVPRRAESTRFATARRSLPSPVDAGISRNFGRDDSGLGHSGISYATASGTPVRAVHGGRVVFADWLRGAGLLVIVDHGDAYMTLYGNNEALEVVAGDSVAAGEPLARSTSADQGGLYFEIRHRGVAQDPKGWLD
jgi:septal ring factor EnvC (AmiA/AmiB activator)